MSRFLAILLLSLSLFELAGCSTEQTVHAAIGFERTLSGLDRNHAEIDGHTVYYLEGGSGETVVMLHGFGGDADNWTRFSRHLTDDYHVIAPDLPGFGESSRLPAASYGVRQQVERVRLLLDQKGIDKVHIGGNSMGGYIAAWFAATYPERVKSLALFDAAGINSPTLSPVLKQILDGGSNRLIIDDPARFDDFLQLIFADPPYIPGFFKDYLAQKAYGNSAFNRKIFDELWSQHLPLEGELPKIKARTLIVWGDQDRVIDISSVPVLQQGLKQVETRAVILPGVGHVPMVERPAETAKAYRTFIAGGA